MTTLPDFSGYQRIVKGSPTTLTLTVNDGSTLVDPGTTTITVTQADSTVLVAAGTATTGSGAAVRTYDLTSANTASTDLLTVDWATTNYGTITTYAEIVGSRIFTLAEARAADKAQLNDSATYPDDTLDEVRSRIEDDFQEICGVSFIKRYVYEYYDGLGTQFLMLRRYSPEPQYLSVRSVDWRTIGSTTWTALTATDLADIFVDGIGLLRRELGAPFWLARQNVRIGYEYGYPRVPLAIKRAALKVAVSNMGLVSSDAPERATSMSSQDGTFRLATPGVRGSWYGIPEVDSILSRYNERTRSFA